MKKNKLRNSNLFAKLNTLPKGVGVYFFKDKLGRILYIGKTLDLRNRVRTHFVKNSSINLKGDFLAKISDIDWIGTSDENEAMILENDLIKKYHPRYNIQWRDDKSFFWVAFSNDEWPRVQVVHQTALLRHSERSEESRLNGRSRIRGRFFAPVKLGLRMTTPVGPFTSGKELKHLLRALRKILPYRTCKNSYEKPCLQWHLGLCSAHKNPTYSPFSKGGSNDVSPLSQKGDRGDLKNYLNLLQTLAQFLKLYAGEPIRIEAYDISNIHGVWATGSMIVFTGVKPKKSDYRRFKIKTVRGANDVAMLKEVLKRRLNHPEWPYPDLILVDGGRAQLSATLQIANHKSPINGKQTSKQLAISDRRFAVIALAKRKEEIYAEFSNKTLRLSTLPSSLKLVFQAIRDEAHRFAIFYYRHLHHKQYSQKRKANERTN